jgi:hypothetical protein
MMCLRTSASHTGRGTGSRPKSPRLTRSTPVLAQLTYFAVSRTRANPACVLVNSFHEKAGRSQ